MAVLNTISIVRLSQDLTQKLSLEIRKECDLSGEPLNQGLINNLFKAICLRPDSTRLAAYDRENDRVIGFLTLKKNADKLFLIENLSVDSSYRNKGLATKLLNSAFNLAQKQGGTKVNLNLYSNNTPALKLYQKLGFKEIHSNILTGQGNMLDLGKFRIIKRAFLGHGFLTKIALGKDSRVIEINNRVKNKSSLFRLYRDCVGKEWIEFFETNTNNFVEGSRRIWHPPFYGNILVNHQYDSLALVFNYPFSYKAAVELYSVSETSSLLFLEDLLEIFAHKGISFVHISVFNPKGRIMEWFNQKNMLISEFRTMGIEL